MAQKIVDADMINTIRRGAEAGLTAVQIAATLDVVVTTVRRHAHRHGIPIAKAQPGQQPRHSRQTDQTTQYSRGQA